LHDASASHSWLIALFVDTESQAAPCAVYVLTQVSHASPCVVTLPFLQYSFLQALSQGPLAPQTHAST
jgi:hypothetical protein